VLRLMITADDCGLSYGIDRAAIDLHSAGMLSTASLICNFPEINSAFERYSAHPEIELGVHLNLSEGKPLSEAARRSPLVRHSGLFHDRFLLFARSFFPSEKLLNVMREELTAQMDVFVQAGLQPAHITTHHHFHSMPALRNIIKDLAQQYQVSWVRNSELRLAMLPFNPIFSQKIDNSVANTPDYLTIVQMWREYPPENLLNAILRLDGWLELVVHPCLAQDPTYPSDVIYSPAERYRELEYLHSFFELLQPHLGKEVELLQGNPQRKRLAHV
jgi:predicted glycoside hydrolase/deacetylase ChbG (UPF0249 family)